MICMSIPVRWDHKLQMRSLINTSICVKNADPKHMLIGSWINVRPLGQQTFPPSCRFASMGKVLFLFACGQMGGGAPLWPAHFSGA